MGSKSWFLIKWTNGRPEIVSKPYESFEDAKKAWDDNSSTEICETVYGYNP